ncbi:hypothetical protein Tco_1197863 [Tanacetum coccineum]
MENANPFGPHVPPNATCDQIAQELDELLEISAIFDSCLENNPLKFLGIDSIVSDAESVDTPLVSPFLNSDDESDDGEVINDIYLNTEYFDMQISLSFEDIGKYIESELSKVVIGKPSKDLTYLEDDCSKVPPLLVLSEGDRMSGLKYPYEKNKLMYKDSLNLGPEYQVDEDMKEWLILGHVSIHETN